MNLKTAVTLGRVSNLPTVWSNVLAGTILAGGTLDPLRTTILVAAMSLLYIAGMYLNDAFDRRVDALERPERPIPAGDVRATTVFAWGYAMLGGGVALVGGLVLIDPEVTILPFASAGLLAGVIVLYDLTHKASRLSPAVMGLCRVGVYATAGLCAVPVPSPPLWVAAGALLAYLIGLTTVARQETRSRFAGAWPVALIAVPFVVADPAKNASALTNLLFTGFLGWVVYALSLLWRRRPAIGKAVVSLIAGIALLDAVALATVGAQGPALLAAGCFLLTLQLQRWVAGT
jgi:hypothetical protein